MPVVLRWMLVVVCVAVVGCGGSKSKKSSSNEPTLAEQVDLAKKEGDPGTRAFRLIGIAERMTDAKDSAGAKQTLTAASVAVEEINDPAAKAERMAALATAQNKAGLQADAKQSTAAARKIIDGLPDSDAKAGALLSLARAQIAIGAVAEAADSLGAAEKVVKGIKTDGNPVAVESQVDRLAECAALFQKIQFVDDSKRCLDTARGLIAEMKEPASRAKGLSKLALGALKMDPAEGDKVVGEALAEAAKESDVLKQTYAYIAIAKDMLNAKSNKNALAAIDAASSSADKIKEKREQDSIRGDLDAMRAKAK